VVVEIWDTADMEVEVLMEAEVLMAIDSTKQIIIIILFSFAYNK
jgi:hypothetical protein